MLGIDASELGEVVAGGGGDEVGPGGPHLEKKMAPSARIAIASE